MRPRIKKYPKLVALTSNDATIQDLCRFNRRQSHKVSHKSYILTCFGIKKTITKKEYEDYISKGLTNLVKIQYD